MALCEHCASDDDEARFLGALGELVRVHRTGMVRVARREGLSGEEALDAVQDGFETFITMRDARALMARPDDAVHVLSAVVRNAARNRRRRHYNARPHTSGDALLELPSGPNGEDHVQRDEELTRLRCCVATLTEIQRRVITLRMLEERPGEDVARELGLSANHVAVTLRRAKSGLRACLSAEP